MIRIWFECVLPKDHVVEVWSPVVVMGGGDLIERGCYIIVKSIPGGGEGGKN